jgi:hypothetical protein
MPAFVARLAAISAQRSASDDDYQLDRAFSNSVESRAQRPQKPGAAARAGANALNFLQSA